MRASRLFQPRLMLLFILSLASLVKPSRTVGQQAPSDLREVQELGEDLFVKSGSTGMVMVVVREKQVLFEGYGETAPGSGRKPDERSLLRLCSLSKIFATDLLAKMVADKTVKLDDPLQRYAPAKVRVPSRPGHPITLLELATHTSGLPREVGVASRGTPHFTFPDYAYRWHWLPNQRLKSVPGTAALYSNVGFDLLGDALEKAAHKPYAKLFAERVTVPLGLKETGFTPNLAQCDRLLQGTHDEGFCTDTQSSAASAGVYSTATDMGVWLRYLLGTGAPAIPAQDPAAQAVYLLPASLLKEQGLDHAGDPTGIGLGWMHILDATDPRTITEKTGGGAGFLTYIALNQAHHIGIFLALTDGAVETHLNVFKEANNLLLALAGLPPIPHDPPKPRPAPRPARRKPHRPS